MTDEKKDAYADGQRDTLIDKIEDEIADIKPRLSRVERIVYGGMSIFGFITYWPSIQRFLSLGGNE